VGHARGGQRRGPPHATCLTAVRRPHYGRMMAGNDDDPRWELPVWNPSSEDLSRWKPEPPERPVWPRRSSPPAPSAAPAVARRESPPRSAPVARPFVWWADHAWVVVWVLVFLAPGVALLLRAIDDASFASAVSPLVWIMVVLFVVVLGMAMLVSAARSVVRAMLRAAASLAAIGLVLWFVTASTLGRTQCPRHAGPDLGASSAAGALGGWQTGESSDALWRAGSSSAAWIERTRGTGLVDYRLIDSGCWERIAPVDITRTWHEFRVTVQTAGGAPISKVVVVNTAANAGGWQVTEIEGPLP
jgi:hypothetical protein